MECIHVKYIDFLIKTYYIQITKDENGVFK